VTPFRTQPRGETTPKRSLWCRLGLHAFETIFVVEETAPGARESYQPEQRIQRCARPGCSAARTLEQIYDTDDFAPYWVVKPRSAPQSDPVDEKAP